MPSIVSRFTEEEVLQYAKDNNLDIINTAQIASKFMEFEADLAKIKKLVG